MRAPDVVVDGSALHDARRDAGIGRYVRSLIAALRPLDRVALHIAAPSQPPGREYWVSRFAHAQPAIWRAARRIRPVLLHAPASEPAVAFPLTRQVVTVHDVEPWLEPTRMSAPDRPYVAFQRRRVRRCAAVIAVSETVAEQATETLRLEAGRVHVIPEGVDDVFDAGQREDDESRRRSAGVTEAGYVLWVGSMHTYDPRKALDVAIDAISAVEGDRLTFVLAGATGDGSSRVSARAARMGIELVLTGFVPDETLAALYRGASAVLLPSLYEGFGLTALEALACASPLVVARGGNLPSLVGEAAVAVDPGDVRSLAAAIAAVVRDKQLRRRLRAAGPEVARLYRWTRTAEATIDVYESAVRSLGPLRR